MGKDITIYPFENRLQMRKNKHFKVLDDLWKAKGFDNPEKTGALFYLIKEAHNKYVKNNTGMLSRNDWIRYYSKSGVERDQKVEDSNSIYNDFYKLNVYHGRSKKDMIAIAEEFLKCFNDLGYTGLSVKEQGALNIVVIKIIDETYEAYQRQMNTLLNLQNQHPELTFELADGLTYERNAVDMFVYKDNNLISALQILPDKEDEDSATKDIDEQKHSFFEDIYGISPVSIKATISGIIISE